MVMKCLGFQLKQKKHVKIYRNRIARNYILKYIYWYKHETTLSHNGHNITIDQNIPSLQLVLMITAIKSKHPLKYNNLTCEY
jgi:hypothetical protein